MKQLNNEKHSKKDELKKLEEQCNEYLNGWKRAKADLANFKKDTEKNQQEFREFATADVILDLLPIHSTFKKAMAHSPNNETMKQCNNDCDDLGTWINGISHIKSQLDKFLKDRGVEEIKTLGEKFNPELHEAVGQCPAKGTESGIITKECSAGYVMNGKVIMVAKVIIAE